MRSTPRYFTPHASAPSPAPDTDQPVFKIRHAQAPIEPVRPIPQWEPLIDGEVELAVHEALDHLSCLFGPSEPIDAPPDLPLRSEATTITPHTRGHEQSVLAAMDQLDSLFSSSGVIEPMRPQPTARVEPEAQVPEIPSSRTPSGQSTPFVLVALLGLAAALAAGFALAQIKRARITAQLLAHQPLPDLKLTPVMAGYSARAEAGDAVAMRLMAFCYQEGVDTPANPREAARWQFQAALAGHPGFAAPEAFQLAQNRP